MRCHQAGTFFKSQDQHSWINATSHNSTHEMFSLSSYHVCDICVDLCPQSPTRHTLSFWVWLQKGGTFSSAPRPFLLHDKFNIASICIFSVIPTPPPPADLSTTTSVSWSEGCGASQADMWPRAQDWPIVCWQRDERLPGSLIAAISSISSICRSGVGGVGGVWVE